MAVPPRAKTANLRYAIATICESCILALGRRTRPITGSKRYLLPVLPAPFGCWRVIGDRQRIESNGIMLLVRLTQANLAFIKRRLRTEFPNVKSSHLSEALAAALGLRTHAALTASLKANEGRLIRTDSAQLGARLSQLGYQVDSSTLKPIAHGQDLPNPCWREIPRRDVAGVNRWFRECQEADIPNIFLSRGTKYVRLEWDMISTNGRGDVGIRGSASQPLMRWLFGAFQSHAKQDPGRPTFYGSSFTGTIERLLPDTARTIADAYFERLYAASREPSG